jgi:hypothetical protein
VKHSPSPLIPAKAGTQAESQDLARAERAFIDSAWVPAFAGMSGVI